MQLLLSKIFVIHENSEWLPPFAAALDYDINTNTNYNPVVEEEAGRSGPVAVARYLAALARELETDRIVNPAG